MEFDSREDYPYCSSIGFIVPVVLVLLIRRLFPERDSLYYIIVNECGCSVLWLLWCFELKTICAHSNYSVGFIVQLTLLTLQSTIYQGAVCNPAVLLARSLHNKWGLHKTLLLFAAQLMSLPISILFVIGEWKVLSFVSRSHEYMSADFVPKDFISVTPFEGFVIEGMGTFILSLPSLVISNGVLLDVASAVTYSLVEFVFGSLSGAFCNPLSATVFCLFYWKQSWLELLLIYWAGSVAGALMSWKLFLDKPKPTQKLD